MTESELQEQVINELKANGYLTMRINSGRTFKRHVSFYYVVSLFLNKKLTTGVSDVIAVKSISLAISQNNSKFVNASHVLYLEIKDAKGKQNKNQIEFQNLCKKHNLEYYVIKNLTELKELI